MRIKQRPEDFSVKESYRFDEVPSGRYRVYLMDKQKLSTFEAVDRLRDAFGLRPGAISYCGLKDKQGRTEQIIAVDGADVDLQEPNLRLKYLGRTDKPLSSANITSNRFSVTVRNLSEAALAPLTVAVAEVNRLGVVNYFDSQRFGSLKHGRGFIAKDLIRGDFEAALHNYLAKPSELDRTEDAKVKQFWADHWGEWNRRVPFEGAARYHRILKSLREHPGDWVRAFLQIDSAHRAMMLFEYQSYLWNEGVRRLLQLLLPREHLFPMRYQAGTLLFHRDAPRDVLHYLRDATFPLFGPDTTFQDDKVREAAEWVLGREKLALRDLVIEESPRLLFFKHEQRPVLSFPHKLVIGRPQRDDINRGDVMVNVAFTLPPGAYATLVVKRLFHFGYREETHEEIRAFQARPRFTEDARTFEAPARAPRATVGGRDSTRAPARTGPRPATPPARPARAAPRAEAPAEPAKPLGFRERQRQKKAAREQAREQAPKQAKSRKKR